MDLHERLVAARKQAGFKSVRDAARALGVPYPTYAGHENGSSGFKPENGELYARRFKVRFEWLMLGTGPMVDLASKYRELLVTFDSLPPDLQENYASILRNLAKPFQPQEPDQEEPQAKAKSA